MPRATRSQGRPGTPVIPVIWDSHRPVVEKTFGATITVRLPGGTADGPFDRTTGTTSVTPFTPHFTGPARIEALPRSDQDLVIAGMEVAAVGYVVSVATDATIEPPGGETIAGCVVHVGTVDSNGDQSLFGRDLFIQSITRGSTVWERHLLCIDKVNGGAP